MYYFLSLVNRQEKSNRILKPQKSKLISPKNILEYRNKKEQIVCVVDPRLAGPHFSPQLSKEKAGVVVAFEGHISNYDSLLKQIKISLPKYHYAGLIQLLYQKQGLEFVKKITGSYSFMIIDKNTDRTILHRDSIGLRPLYYYLDDQKLIAGTYLKAILDQPFVKKEINWSRLYSYFMVDGMSLGGDTEYKNIHNLAPGDVLLISTTATSYRTVAPQKNYELVGQKEQTVIKDFYSIIKQANKHILDLNRSIGIAFSGGLDTNTILALAHEYKIKTNTYTIKYQTESSVKQKDFQVAKDRAKMYRTDHLDIEFTPEQFIEHLNDSLNQLERIFTLPELNSLLICKLISKHCNLTLSGDASEEQLGLMNMQIFGFRADQLVQDLPRHNAIEMSRSFINNYYDMLFWRGWGWHYQLRDEVSLRKAIFTSEYEKILKQIDLYKIFTAAYRQSPDSSFYLIERSVVPSLFNKVLWLDFKNFVLPNKMAASDLASRLYSISTFFPYMDNNFVEYASQIPAELKLESTDVDGTKFIFRQAVAGLVGKENAFPGWKSGSDVPLIEWFLKPVVKHYIMSILKLDRIKKFGILNSEYVLRVLEEHYHDSKLIYTDSAIIGKSGIDHTHKIGKLLCFQLWLENNFG